MLHKIIIINLLLFVFTISICSAKPNWQYLGTMQDLTNTTVSIYYDRNSITADKFYVHKYNATMYEIKALISVDNDKEKIHYKVKYAFTTMINNKTNEFIGYKYTPLKFWIYDNIEQKYIKQKMDEIDIANFKTGLEGFLIVKLTRLYRPK